MIPNPQFDTNNMDNDDLQNPLYNPNGPPPPPHSHTHKHFLEVSDKVKL